MDRTQPDPAKTTPPGRSRVPRSAGGAGILALLALLAWIGPRARVDEGALTPGESGALPGLDHLEEELRRREGAVPGLRSGDGAGIVWADPGVPRRTPLAVVYIHGFSADRHEIDPVPQHVASGLGANLYLARLTGHGQDGAALGEATAEDWLRDTEEALAVGARLGEQIVLMGTSTGGTLAAWGAGRGAWRDRVAALVLVSPNFGPRDRKAELLLWPWGGLLARLLVGSERCFEPLNEAQARHWTTCYPTRALLPMMAIVDHVRRSDLGAVRAPLLVLHSPDDSVVDAAATQRLFHAFGSEPKRIIAVRSTTDPARHVLAGEILSPASVAPVVDGILLFVQGLAGAGTQP